MGDIGDRLTELCRELLTERRLIIVSNRGPVEYHETEDGRLETDRGRGGVVTALSALGRYVTDYTQVCCAMSEGDRCAAERAQNKRFRLSLPGQRFYLRFATPSEDAYHKYYNVFCNPLLWFLQHYLWDLTYVPNIDRKIYDAWENGYVPVNQALAEAVITEAREDSSLPLIMLHDYHLYLVAGYIRSQIPEVLMQHFIHIPWPAPRYWQLLPGIMCRSILESLCATDIVGLQTRRDVHNFLHTCDFLLDGAKVDYQGQSIKWNEHLTRVIAYPISIDVAELRELACSPEVQEYEARLRPYFEGQTIIRVDRADPSKNIVRGLRAFRILLRRYPQLKGKVKLVLFLIPSRSGIKQYQRYALRIMELVNTINDKYGGEEWQPITVFYENNYLQAIAGMRNYDVLLVNPVLDGMNLVAKEGPVVNARDGVLVLSETAGAYEQLGSSALSVVPTDLEGTAQALYAALTMNPEERKRRAEALRMAIEAEDLTLWLYRQLEDIKDLAQKQHLKAR